MSLFEVLMWLMSGGGAAVATFWLMENVPRLKKLAPAYRRYASLGLAAGLAVLAWVLLVLLGYVTAPETVQGWGEALFSVGFVAVMGSQGAHGALRLARGDKGVEDRRWPPGGGK